MVFESSVEELPPGWKEQVKVYSSGRKVKCYTHQEKGLKLYSKTEVLSYDKMRSSEGTLQLVTEQKQESSPSKSKDDPIAVDDELLPEWLPRGWMVDPRSRKNGPSAGSTYKIYVELKTGRKFRSKTQVMKYLESVGSNSTPKNQKQVGNGYKCLKQDALQDPQPMVDKSIITGENNNLVVGITFEEFSADKYLTQDAAPNRQPLVDNSVISGKDDNDMVKMALQFDYKVVDRSSVLDGFPPGWVKESRPRKMDSRKDPYYIDPISGYEFRSKMDARRYLETGDIRSCRIKPRKSVVKFEDDASAPKTDSLNIDPIAIDYHGALSGSPTAVLQSSNLSEAKKSKERETYSISTSPSSTTMDANEDKKLTCEVLECCGSEHSSEANIKGSNPYAKLNDDRAVSITTNAELQDQKPAEDQLDIKPPDNLAKSKKRKSRNIPARSSKRLSGQEPDIQPMMLSSGRVLRAASKKSQKEVNASVKEQKAAADGLPHPLDINVKSELPADPRFSCTSSLETEIRCNIEKPLVCQVVPEPPDLPSSCKVASLQTDMRNNNNKPYLGQDVPDRAVGQPGEENPGSQDWYPFGDSLSDPCYEFAFKTLTGEIPLEETLAFHNLFQQSSEGSCTQGRLNVGLTEIDTTPLFQNDVPYQPHPVQNNLPSGQQPCNTNVTLSSCATFGSQQSGLEARRKDYKTKVNS
ncbi:OLC1v1029613C1 [Oldenlandia corymbosa var. corymbosa]|uniref:OLC1v1029613C1 n=1 Tax=Oldenlandia corymbosa var. corymbosa TaxID=529605 RepID=A0AAV1CF00_OLDCO|nr:OLC1v1029613C1 [Oldenlandia corymbosa var. corymbosa]